MHTETPSPSIDLNFENNSLLPLLFGEHDKYISRIEKALHVSAFCRGNSIMISGEPEALNISKAVLEDLYDMVKTGHKISSSDVDAAIRLARENITSGLSGGLLESPLVIRTPKKHIHPYSKTQHEYFKALAAKEVVFAIGPAGTGKTYIAVAQAVAMFAARKVERIILSRPAVEAGEKLGFLPGDLKEKIDPYLRPLYDALYDMMPAEKVVKHIENGEIELAPLAFMRGRTLSNAFIILDEAQNSTPVQMKMFLTRIGENSRMVICGDLTQIDLPGSVPSGLKDATTKLSGIDEIGFVSFVKGDVLRHPIAAKIVSAYEEAES